MKTAKGFLKHLIKLTNNQDMSDCTDWHNLTEEQQRLFYALLAGIQNDIGEIESTESINGYLDTIHQTANL